MTLSSPPKVLRHDAAGIATLTLNTPASRNALSLAMIEALIAAFDSVAADKKIRVVVLAGEGPAISSGHDLKEIMAHQNDADRGEGFYQRLFARCADLMQQIGDCSKPVIAAVEGVATAAGCQIVAACDLAVAGEKARFALPGVNTGLFCSSPLVAVGRAISRKHAMEMALTGAHYGAKDAERFGLVNRVVAEGRALAEAQKLGESIASRSAAALVIGKRTFYRQIETPLAEAYVLASQAMVDNLAHPDAGEGIGAFLEKRAPKWEGA